MMAELKSRNPVAVPAPSKQEHPYRVAISLLLSPVITAMQKELEKAAILSLIEGFVNKTSVLKVAPLVINKLLAGPITTLNECTFLVPLTSRTNVMDVCKLRSFKVAKKDGSCTLKLSP